MYVIATYTYGKMKYKQNPWLLSSNFIRNEVR